MHHQQVDIVAFRSHDLHQRGHTVDAKAIEAPEVEQHRTVIDRGKTDDERKHRDQRDAHDDA